MYLGGNDPQQSQKKRQNLGEIDAFMMTTSEMRRAKDADASRSAAQSRSGAAAACSQPLPGEVNPRVLFLYF